jgi:hypothetical protein
MIFVGVEALLWATWCTRKELVFEKKTFQVVYAGHF